VAWDNVGGKQFRALFVDCYEGGWAWGDGQSIHWRMRPVRYKFFSLLRGGGRGTLLNVNNLRILSNEQMKAGELIRIGR
jgi:hypothetical protein